MKRKRETLTQKWTWQLRVVEETGFRVLLKYRFCTRVPMLCRLLRNCFTFVLHFSLTGTSGGGFSLPKGGSKGEKPNRAPALAPAPTVRPLNFRSRILLPTGRIASFRRDLRKVFWTFCPKPPGTGMDFLLQPGQVEPPPRGLWGVNFLSGLFFV